MFVSSKEGNFKLFIIIITALINIIYADAQSDSLITKVNVKFMEADSIFEEICQDNPLVEVEGKIFRNLYLGFAQHSTPIYFFLNSDGKRICFNTEKSYTKRQRLEYYNCYVRNNNIKLPDDISSFIYLFQLIYYYNYNSELFLPLGTYRDIPEDGMGDIYKMSKRVKDEVKPLSFKILGPEKLYVEYYLYLNGKIFFNKMKIEKSQISSFISEFIGKGGIQNLYE